MSPTATRRCKARTAAHEAARRKLHGVICGHIHRPALRQVDGIVYANDDAA